MFRKIIRSIIAGTFLRRSRDGFASFRKTYWPDTPILRYGHARNDILFNNTPEFRNEIRKRVLTKIGILHQYAEFQDAAEIEGYMNANYVIYAPTFRDVGSIEELTLDYYALILALQKKFGGTWKVLVRYHPKDKSKWAKKPSTRHIINVTTYPDMQELLVMADAAITDYSSWICDFVLTRRPGFLFATDMEAYNNERGFYYPLNTTPFSVATSEEELIQNICSFNETEYIKKTDEFIADKGCVDDGHAAQRVVDKIQEILVGESL